MLYTYKRVGGKLMRIPRARKLVQVFALKKADVCDYGTVVPSTDAADMTAYETEWLKLGEDNDFAAYFATRLKYYYSLDPGNGLKALWKSVKGKTVREKARNILPLLRGLNLVGSATGVILSPRKQKRTNMGLAPSLHTMKTRSRGVVKGKGSSKFRALALFAVQPSLSPPGALPSRPQAGQDSNLTWHDVLVSELMDVTDLNATDLAEINLPTATTAAQVVVDGQTAVWVDLPTYLDFLERVSETVFTMFLMFRSSTFFIPILLKALTKWHTFSSRPLSY